MKKFFTLIVLCVFSIGTIHAKITWSLSDDGTLTISGTDMPNYGYNDCPWNSQRNRIKKIVIENGVTNIVNFAFCNCKNLTLIIIPSSVLEIGQSAFSSCSSLSSITIPNSVKSIGSQAFSYCSGLTSITLPNSVMSIGELTFSECSNLKSVTIDNSEICIGTSAFSECSNLISVNMGNSTTSIESLAFYKCISLISVDIPNSVTCIGNSAFEECKALTSVSIGNSVTSIGKYAFAWCSNLTSITIPRLVTSIDQFAFYGCSNLSSLTISNSVMSIGQSAFEYCSGLTSIISKANTPPVCANYCFNEINKSIPVYVPANSVETYKKADGWKEFVNIQAIPTYVLADGELYTNNYQLNGRDISYTRNFSNTNWQALYIPFSLNYNDWKNDFEVAYINGVRQLDKDDNGTIDETIMDVIKIKSGSTTPNMPYLIKAKTTGEKTFSVNNATLYAAEENSLDCSTTIAKYTFTGTYSSIPSSTMIANGYYAMGGGDLIQSDGSNDLKPYRWYMKVESRNPSYNVSNAAKTITINVVGDEEEETTTGVKELRITNDELPVYDINGRMVSNKTLKPGLYIKNGKKFVVK